MVALKIKERSIGRDQEFAIILLLKMAERTVLVFQQQFRFVVKNISVFKMVLNISIADNEGKKDVEGRQERIGKCQD